MLAIKKFQKTIIMGSIMLATFFVSADDSKGFGANQVSWLNSKLVVRKKDRGKGVFAKAKVSRHEPLAVFGGVILTKKEVLALPQELIPLVLQIDQGLWISSLSTTQEPDMINHCCEPNAGMSGQIMLVAMRDIKVGEEITFDFAMVISEWVGMDPIACTCGAANCRKTVGQDDWKIKELQKKYKGYFSSYLERMIFFQSWDEVLAILK
jgi:hypothetical protein